MNRPRFLEVKVSSATMINLTEIEKVYPGMVITQDGDRNILIDYKSVKLTISLIRSTNEIIEELKRYLVVPNEVDVK